MGDNWMFPPADSIELHDYAAQMGMSTTEAARSLERAGWRDWGESISSGGVYYIPPEERLCNCGSGWSVMLCPESTLFCG